MMHPVLAAGFVNAVTADHRTAAVRRRAARRGADTSGHPAPADDAADVTIRSATRADGTALVALGALDGNRAAGELLAYAAARDAGGGVLIAEVDGAIESALAIDGGLAVADPFRPSAQHAPLLALRARQLGGDVPRSGPGHLRVLHLRTS